MKGFLDTNILLDVLCRREPFFHDSQLILSFCEHFLLNGYVSTLSFCTIAYVLRKYSGQTCALDSLRRLRVLVKPVELSTEILDKSLNAAQNDFEDTIQFYSAAQVHADCIITRNPEDFKLPGIAVITPAEFVGRCKFVRGKLVLE
ncbi:MAG: PIN domain-containing protein [Lentisphaeria bacterium]|nr:PIN domain-containing protein [Lentisphaeria bacterium]